MLHIFTFCFEKDVTSFYNKFKNQGEIDKWRKIIYLSSKDYSQLQKTCPRRTLFLQTYPRKKT